MLPSALRVGPRAIHGALGRSGPSFQFQRHSCPGTGRTRDRLLLAVSQFALQRGLTDDLLPKIYRDVFAVDPEAQRSESRDHWILYQFRNFGLPFPADIAESICPASTPFVGEVRYLRAFEICGHHVGLFLGETLSESDHDDDTDLIDESD